MTQANYQATRLGAKSRNADIYPPYTQIWEYRKNNCSPYGIVFKDNEVVASMQMVLDHQMTKLFDDPQLKSRASVLVENGLPITCYFKYGFDGMGQVHNIP